MNQERSTFEKRLDTFEEQAVSVFLELKNGREYVGIVSRNYASGEWQISTRRAPLPESILSDAIPFQVVDIAQLAEESAWSLRSG
jgi:hypothetical protein